MQENQKTFYLKALVRIKILNHGSEEAHLFYYHVWMQDCKKLITKRVIATVTKEIQELESERAKREVI